uniref:Death domain-containing protein n=1 Tax=Amphimedon queenslandica TaxID=400682 RepID=A0A1X7T621_AMPQE
MIDVSQWRANIGLWNYCQAASSRPANGCHSHSFKAAVDSKSSSTTSGEKTSKLPTALSLIAFLLLLFLSLSLLRHILMISPTGNCYQVQCTTGVTVTDTNYLQSLVLPGGSSSNLIYNDFYLIVCLRMLLLLSGDVELNPGPMIDDRPDIALLTQWLEPLVEWKPFGRCLPQLTYSDISKIEAENVKIDEQKSALYSKWLSVNPTATWRDVIDALTSRNQNKLAQDIKDHMDNDALSASPRTSNSDEDVEIIFFPKKDQKVQDSLHELQAKFSHIMTEIKSIFRKKVTDNDELSTKICDWVEHQLNLKHGTVDNDLDDIFAKIYHHYDFIDCSLIVVMCNEFISDEEALLDELKTYSLYANIFRSSETIKDLKLKLRKVYGPYRRKLENMPLICIELQNPWNDVTINGLYILIERIVPKELRQSIMKCITIESGSVVIKLHILDITADSLIEFTAVKLQFMRLIGIFSLYINDHPVLQENENVYLTFEIALLEAVTAGNNEAVEFLLQLGYIDHTNEEGKTALMLACERGHEDIVHSLLSAGANVDIQDIRGWTALMIASEHNHSPILYMLLEANANPYLTILDGSNALMIASYYGNYEVIELLISKGVDYKYQRDDGVNTFILACQNGHIQIVELLLKEQVDPSIQRNDGGNALMLACQDGHIQIVELLLKEQVDPNVQKNDGVTALMLASANEHYEVVKLLLEWKANPTIKSAKGNTALSLAKTDETKTLLNDYLKKGNLKEDDAASVCSFASQQTVTSGHHTVSDISSTRTFPSTLTLDSGIENLTDKK